MTDTPERALLAECARVMRYVTLQPSDPNDTGSNNADDQRAYYAALDAAERALLAQPAPEGEKCPVCDVPTVPIGARCPQCNETFWTPEELKPIWVSRVPRAEAEAMLKRYDESVVALQEGPMEALVPDAAEFDDARAALLAALTHTQERT